jgi:sulfite oxidase
MLGGKSDLIVHSEAPYNAEPTLDRLRESMRTAQTDFYVRSHGNIPQLDAATHRLTVRGSVKTQLHLSLDELRRDFPIRTVQAVIQCAGNRRSDMLQVGPVSGEPWAPGAIGNADWTGVRLADILRAAGADEIASLHVAFDSLDSCEVEGHKFCYGVSIPIAKAMSPEVLLAYMMNGEDLPPAHGAPLRVVVPGFAGVRSPKWLATITVQDRPSDNYIQAEDYKLFPPDKTKETADPENGITIYDMPLNSAICEPAPNSRLKTDTAKVRGWAVAAGRAIARVDVSIDGGRNWAQAEMEHDPKAPWSWTFWEHTVELQKGEHELAVRAWDSACQTQPALPDDTWNFKGYLSASWHRVRIKVV